MSIGEKNRRITINKPDPAVDTANQSVGWLFHKKVWAAIVGETGMGRIRAEASLGGVNTDPSRYSFRVNYDLSLAKGMQAVDSHGIQYDVLHVFHDHANRVNTFLVCEEGGRYGS